MDIQFFFDNIYIGNMCGALDEKALVKNRIKTVVHLMDYRFRKIDGVKQFTLSIEDSENQNLLSSFAIFDKIIELHQKENIFIHCQHGVSRTGAFAVYYLIKHKNIRYDDALRMAINIRDCINPNPGFRKQLVQIDNYIHMAHKRK